MDLAIRISRSYEEVYDWVNDLTADKILVYQHDADDEVSRTHIHMLLIGSTLKPDALKARYKKLYGNIEAKDWSFKKSDGDVKYITYMSKGIIPPSFSKGYTVSEIEEYTKLWVDKTMLKVEDGKFVRDIDEPGQKTKFQLLEQMRSQLCGKDSTRLDILKIIRKVLVKNRVVLGQWKAMDYYDSLMMYERKQDWLAGMEAKLNSRGGI